MAWDNGETTNPATVAAAPPGEMERALAQIAGIRAARVVTDASGRITEVHVLAEPGRAPKQLVRDIQSAVLTGFGISIDYRVVSVVQLDKETKADALPHIPAPRPVLRRLSAETASFSTEVSVGVAVAGAEIARTSRGPATAGLRLVAQATVDAISEAISAEAVEIESAAVVEAGARQIALVVLRVLTGRGDHIVAGSAVVRRDPGDAIARASLDALNRFVGTA